MCVSTTVLLLVPPISKPSSSCGRRFHFHVLFCDTLHFFFQLDSLGRMKMGRCNIASSDLNLFVFVKFVHGMSHIK